MIIDGTSEPDFAGSPVVELEGSGAGTDADGLNIIAGSSTVKGLVINGFGGVGIELSTSGGNTIEGNYIGTDVNGTVALGNFRDGVMVVDVPNNMIGAVGIGAGNLISGNNERGVSINGDGATGNLVQGNFIGTDVDGTADLGNRNGGLSIQTAPNNTIGGAAVGAGNVISGNNSFGVEIAGSRATGNSVQGNFIGTDVDGTANLGNSSYGVIIQTASNNIIGGATSGAGNVISGNRLDGVFILDGAADNQVQGNHIGTDTSGVLDLGNFRSGVVIWPNSSDNTIGGSTASAGNVIAFNGWDGITVFGSGNATRANSISGNKGIGSLTSEGLGIDLGADGVTPNDAGDGDSGANNLQNFPVLTSATQGSTTIEGTLNSTPNTQFTLEYFSNTACDPSGFGEGETFLGSTTVTTDGSGNASFTVTFSATVPAGDFITATATDPSNNTSEFSECIAVAAAPPPPPGPPAVGGILEIVSAPPDSPQSEAYDSGPSPLPYVALAGGAVIALLAGGWYIRRRWLR